MFCLGSLSIYCCWWCWLLLASFCPTSIFSIHLCTFWYYRSGEWMDDAIHDRIHRQKLLIGNLSGKLQLINSFPITISSFVFTHSTGWKQFVFHAFTNTRDAELHFQILQNHTYWCLVCSIVINNEWILPAPALPISTF